jgi:hypothetical protein
MRNLQYIRIYITNKTKKQTNALASVRERTNRQSDRRLSAKLVPTFADRGRIYVTERLNQER